MWFDTEITGTFTITKGHQMVSFAAKRKDGRNWAAPLWLVSRGIGGNADTGLAVRIEVDGESVKSVQRNRHQPVGAVQAVPANVLPYGFVPIKIDRAAYDAPVWHDGSGGGELLSGEILCELEALTPLLPGNMRYDIEKADREKLGIDYFEELAKKKQVAEPLRLSDRRVVIAGSAIKGMIRQSLGALLSAPMERVAEHHYSYRPNLDFNLGVKERYVVRPAFVIKAKNGGWEIEVFGDARDALFVRKEAEDVIRKASSDDKITGQVKGVEREKIPQKNKPPKITNHLIPSSASMALSHRLADYKGGIDGKGLLAAAFQKKDDEEVDGRYVCKKYNPKKCRGPFTYDLALVPLKADHSLEITAELYRRYLEHQKKIIANNEFGHLTAHPLEVEVDQVAKNIEAHSAFSPRQLIYVELTTDQQGKVTKGSKVVSCGHHFRYRWAYTSSVRSKDGQPRPCLTPMEFERTQDGKDRGEDIAPKHLTGARLLFGYVRDPKKNPIGKGVYERLAGRIAINHAVSDGVPEFLSPETGYCVPLKILGQPKPSAWEFYLQQPQDENKRLATYGDLSGDAGGDLAGRKFYRHQTSVSLDGIKATTDEEKKSYQATLAHFICAPQTTFKFAIRFMRLRDWEFGALLAVLQPHLLKQDSKPDCYAHKLGLGRPLGMGSVRITPKEIRVRLEKDVNFLGQEAGDERVKLALEALQGKLNAGILKDWLEAHELVDGNRLDYPRYQPPRQTKPTIFDWHTKLRGDYSKLRREEGANWSQLSNTVRKVK